ncbi:hypothetical protein Tco_0290898 [Tanacetum coccineum]
MTLITSKERHIREPISYLDSGCSWSMTGVKSYLHKYVEQPCPKQGTIFNANREIVLIAPRRNDVYVFAMSSLTPNGACFVAKASESETNAFIRPLEGDARKTYGEYVCFNVLEGCQVIISELEIVKTDMISKRSLQLHDVGDMTFKLNGSWIAQRVEKMLINGIDTWAPVIYERRARAIFLSRTNTPYMNDDMLRAYCIKHALVRMFLYSRIDVLDADSDNGFGDPSYEPCAPSNHVYAELETIKYGVCMDKADVMVYILEKP